MAQKTILIVVLLIIAAGFLYYRIFVKNKESSYSLEKVSKATVLREVKQSRVLRLRYE